MKTAACLMLLTLSAVAADTNIIDLQQQPFAITNLQGKAQYGKLLTADLDGVLYHMPDGIWRNRISYTNLTPAMLEMWGIPTNRIQIAIERAQKKKLADKAYEESLAAQYRQGAEDREAMNAAAAEQAAKEAAMKPYRDIDAQKKLIQQLQARWDQLHDYYKDTPSGYTVWNNGVLTDSDYIRRQNARSAQYELDAATEKLEEMVAALQPAK
jgi:hypothetical protein